jgi:hypothetical protein
VDGGTVRVGVEAYADIEFLILKEFDEVLLYQEYAVDMRIVDKKRCCIAFGDPGNVRLRILVTQGRQNRGRSKNIPDGREFHNKNPGDHFVVISAPFARSAIHLMEAAWHRTFIVSAISVNDH